MFEWTTLHLHRSSRVFRGIETAYYVKYVHSDYQAMPTGTKTTQL